METENIHRCCCCDSCDGYRSRVSTCGEVLPDTGCQSKLFKMEYKWSTNPIHRKHSTAGRLVTLRQCIRKRRYISDLYVIFVLVLLLSHTVNGQDQTVNQNIRPFPPLFNAALNRPILTAPSQGTCGVPERSAYCKSSIYEISVENCNQDFCVQQCPGREELPGHMELLVQTTGYSKCVYLDTINMRPGAAFQSASTTFGDSGPRCFLTPAVSPLVTLTQEFTFTFWVWQRQDNNGTLIQKVSKTTGEIILELNLRQSYLNFVYRSSVGLLTVTFPEQIPSETWTYLAVQVYGTRLSFFMNGLGPGFSAAYTVSLVSQVQEATESWLRVGLTLSGTYQFLGRLQDFRFYEVTLSNREIEEDFSGQFPELRVQSSCRCPASHPRVKPFQVHYCIQNGVPDNTNDNELRLNREAHPLEYVNDGDANSVWISDFMNDVNLIVDLGDQFQVFYVVLLFYSPFPAAVEMQRKVAPSAAQWDTWQRFASDCTQYFGVPNNGLLPSPASVNCLQIPLDPSKYSKGNITFNMLNPEPVPRPGYNDFYNTPELFDFVMASQVRVHMTDHLYVTNERHKYYGLYEYSVIARCECHGHAETCDHATLPYTCHCLQESHTEGRQCSSCQPLYNDKPFRRGDQIEAFNCRRCECYGHAASCVYNATLDAFPDDHYAGGGGVCVDCRDHTEGRFCETCVTGFYRPTGRSMYDTDVCVTCDCFTLGVNNSHMDCAKEGGQCECKENVQGRQCDVCKAGFYNLSADNPVGCQPCGCDLAGTVGADDTCLPDTGQCNCKPSVRGEKCDSCQYGFFNLNMSNPDGCGPCNCNPFGSTNQFCEPDTGQCLCKPNIESRQCSECADGFWAFDSLCLPCNCDPLGTTPDGKCNKYTGQCECKDNVEGLKCGECRDETFGFGMSVEYGCVTCTCNPAGTVNGSMLCDKVSGDCVCRDNVQGSSCNQCKGNTWGLRDENPAGCESCECDRTGTYLGHTLGVEELSCEQNTGQCTCLTNRIGRQCDDCESGYYISTELGGGCLNCVCHPKGSLPLTVCDSMTGQCECKGGNSGVTGISCNQCLEGYYDFDGRDGECNDCDCDPAGSINSTCNPEDGTCFCKEFTYRRRCDRCVKESSFLEASNPYGCSKAPAQQPPPYHDPLSSTSLRLYWKEPDYTNGVISQYRIHRNATVIFVLDGNARTVDDVDLQPFTMYSYTVEATNDYGSVTSSPISFRTPAGAPYGTVVLNATNIQAKSARFSWNQPQIMNGPLLKYVLYSETDRNTTRVDQWEGQDVAVTLTSLVPFTNYIFHVDSCTEGGCLTSLPVLFTTMSAVPEGLAAPVVLAVNNTALNITWEPPAFPNGIIIFYELWMRGALQYDGSRIPSETRIFHPGGQFNPRPTQIPQENALPPPETEYILTGLDPFTPYEFQVLAENSAGKAASPWVSGRTGATYPSYTPPPYIISLSSYSLNITWAAPTPEDARGIILLYRVYYYRETDLTGNPFAPPFTWQLLEETDTRMYYILRGLSPYTDHTVMVEACNAVGCINSTMVEGRTQQDIPEGLPKPGITGLNSSVMEIVWTPPAFPNGPPPHYTIQKTTPALSYPPQVISGTRFPGGGYYLFPPDTIPPNVDFTGIRFWFRTRKRDGLLLFAASEGRQDEFVALQFKAGRPWFLYDPQGGCEQVVTPQSDPNNDRIYTFHDGEWHHIQVNRTDTNSYIIVDGRHTGCASYVSPTNDEGLIYNNNIWHHIMAWRDENVAYISIDNKWTGTRVARCAKGNIIGPNTGVYVGGIPPDFEIRRKSSDSRLQIKTQSFQGCIRDIQIMQQKYPQEVWKTLEWDKAIHNELAFLNWEGCPINLDRGVHFMGQGYARFPSDKLQMGNAKRITFGFRTQMHTGILYYVHGGTGIYMYCALINGALHFEFANGILVGAVTFNRPEVNFCDSKWYDIELIKDGQQAKIIVKDVGEEVTGDPGVSLPVLTSSDLYVGGVQLESEAHKFALNNKLTMPIAAFGGCVKDVKFDSFTQLNFLEEIIEVVNMNMDGCTSYHVHQDTCRDDLITDVYNGTDMITHDKGLQPYTDYLYRVMATNDAGSGTSLWGYGRTKEGAPIGVTAPYESHSYSGYLVEFKWLAPISTAGLLIKFVLKAYNMDNPALIPVEATFTNTSKRIGNISDVIPYTNYEVQMLACTSGGCSESRDGFQVHTMEEAPEKVPAPTGISGPSYIYVTWDPPAAPNGLITGYFLYRDGVLVYTGGGRAYNDTSDLRVYTSYVFYLRACTKVGCTTGPSATLSSAQRPPEFVKTPTLIALGTSSVEVRWETPDQINGVLERYLLYASNVAGERGEVAYNNSDFFLDYTIHKLTAGTTYFITLAACTGGGCTFSLPSNVTTEESAPGNIYPPTVTSPSPSQLIVAWELPGMPNGEIIRYDLFHNETPVYSGMKMEHGIGGQQPYSLHAFRLVACTRRGCGSSSLTKARTMEAAPEGFINMELRVEDPRTVSVKWAAPEKQNGDMYFDVYFEGLYYTDPDNWDYSTYYDRQSVLRTQAHTEWLAVGPLVPLSTYSVQVNASNSVGYIMSNVDNVDMPPGSPDGVRPPSLVSQTPSTITATWASVGRQNSLDEALFILQFREKTPGSLVQDIFGPTTSFTYTKENLVAYKEYEFRLVAQNSHGVSRSAWVTATTQQDKPAGFSAPVVVGHGPRYIDIVWQHPLSPNGVLQEYKIYQNGQYRESMPGNATQLRADRLSAHQNYIFIIEACTAGGCTRSPPSIAQQTKEDLPEEVVPPTAVSLTPASVELSWQAPDFPNGVISLYTLERRVAGNIETTVVVSMAASDPKKYVDDDSTLTPYSDYEYRLIVTNGAGDGFSLWTPVTTMSSRPAGVRPPSVTMLGPTLLNVTWQEPLQPNGIIEFYTVRLPVPRIEVRNISQLSVLVSDLTAYTEYSVTVSACTEGGCTQSSPVNVRTHATLPEGMLPPDATPVSQTMISVVWQSPQFPNGPNIRYELSRLFLRQPLNPRINTSDEVWVSLYEGTGMFVEDRGLPMFSTYRYRVTVYNDIGLLTSEPTPEITTFGGFPRRAATVIATPVSHRIIVVNWETPDEVELQGSVKEYLVELQSHLRNYSDTFGPGESSTTFSSLQPNTEYTALVTITIHGGAYITSDPAYATTLDGAPEGVDVPTLSIVSETALRVSWMAPERPNGQVTGYFLYNNGERTDTGLTIPGSYVMTDLQPYTVYEIQLEVCTVFDCVRSERVMGSTLEALPQSMGAPRLMSLSPYQVNAVWHAPLQPNGIILRYDLWRRTIRQCSDIPKVTVSPEVTKCTYIQCGILQNLCGATCYSGAKVCCDGVLHDSQPGYQCCGTSYAPMSAPSDVCCGGEFYTYRPDHMCCNTRYELVLPGETCCYDNREDRVTVGKGDQCCGMTPYSSVGAQICCAGKLYEGFGQQCCGGQLVGAGQVCCGGGALGHAYSPREQWACCGQQYVQEDTTLCCTSDTKHVKVHHYERLEEKEAANQQCCGLETISKGLSCCNYVGYNPASQFCADISHQQSGCGSGTVCLKSHKDAAFCDRCDFDPYTYMCGSVGGHHDLEPVPTPTPPAPSDNCVVAEEKVYTGLDTDFLDENLQPYALYDYAVSVVNSAGTTKSTFTRIKTLQARPEGLEPPTANLDPRQLYMIFLSWKAPIQPNGEILQFILVRDGIELYRGLDFLYTDDTTILPYRSYSYILTACTVAGCITSPAITVATAQGAPEGVAAPALAVVEATSLEVSWAPPDTPNGIIAQYTLHFRGEERQDAYNTTQLDMLIQDLLPYTRYNASLTVCTEVACTNSSQVSVLMPEAAPQGVQAPEIVVRNSTSVDVYWSVPLQPNGRVIFYSLIRSEKSNQLRQFVNEDFHATDYSLVPGRTYMYFVVCGTAAGNTSSNATSITMPTSTPPDIPAPANVTVLSATSVYVGWDPVPASNGAIDQYRVFLKDDGGNPAVDRGVGLNTFVTITGLIPYTNYEVRVQACLEGVPNGCGTGPGVTVKTFEAAPTYLDKPDVRTEGPNIVDVRWKAPKYPNGIITQYLVYYRQLDQEVQLLINRVNNQTFYIRHAGSELTPYTMYEYKVVAGNSEGDVSSAWSTVRTQAAPPTGLPEPAVTVTGAFSIDLAWVQPARPNGDISVYKIIYRKIGLDPTVGDNTQSLTINGNLTKTSISGLDPFSDYQLRIQAFNSAGNISSIWTTFKTGESSPSGLGTFDVERLQSGTAVILRWGIPAQPNGIITTYKIFESASDIAAFQGLNREFEMRRLEAYREYSVQLEACTAAGCTRSFSQAFYTAETNPTGQAAPTMSDATATSVMIRWVEPVSANGKITMYEVLRRANTRIKKRSVTDAVVVYRTTDTDLAEYSYVDSQLRPFTEYQYAVRATNTQGSTVSPWQAVFTLQATPAGVQPPLVLHVPDILDALQVTWATPDSPNGILQSYQLQRNDSVPLSFTPQDVKSYVDVGLRPYTVYSYTITACSGGGCTTSEPTSRTTKETAPLKVTPPTIFAVNSTALRLTWLKPQVVTGDISAYQLHMNDVVIYEGLQQDYLVKNLIPFTDYTFKLSACTLGGCTDSGEVTGKPADDVPEDMPPPILRVMSARSIEVSWSPPVRPNGVIISYDVRRNGRLIYTESISVAGSLKTLYTDYNLEAGTEYAYVVTATNMKGSVESAPALARTFASSPNGLDPPTLSAISSTSIQVSWTIPASPNGVIKNYTVFRDGDLVYSGSPTQMSYIVPGLQFWTQYTFRVQACTERGCTLSTGATGRTLPARPEEQAPPSLLALANQNGAHAGVMVEWEPPLKPNGVIGRYEVYRRLVIDLPTGITYGPVKLVYNGSALSYTDRDAGLLAFREYSYSVSAVNLVGKVSSDWATVMTKEAPPTTVPAPIIEGTTATTITVTVTPPSEPNGIVRYYNILVNDTVASSSVDLEQVVGQTVPLSPFHVYSLRVEACTAGGCTTSPATISQTGSARPAGQEPVRVLEINSTAVKLTWSHPTQPNGRITKFVLYQRTGCPPTPQLYDQPCAEGDARTLYEGLYIEKVVAGLAPYTAYDFQVQSVNNAGPINFPIWVRVETTAESPVYVQYPLLRKNESSAIVDWSASFVLNSKLLRYRVVRDGVGLYSGVDTSFSLQRASPTENMMFKIHAETETGAAESPTIVFDPNAVNNIGTTPVVVASTEMVSDSPVFYREVWFIAVVVLVGVLLLLALLACCIRSCGRHNPYIRERLPLQLRQRKQPFTFMLDNTDNSLMAMDGPPPNTDPSGYYSGSVAHGVVNPTYVTGHHLGHRGKLAVDSSSEKTSGDSLFDNEDMDGPPPNTDPSGYYSGSVAQGVVNPAYAAGHHLGHRKLPVDSSSEKTSGDSLFDDEDMVEEDDEDFLWDKNQDSGLVSAYDSDNTDAPSYSITKEQTVFTDTHL